VQLAVFVTQTFDIKTPSYDIVIDGVTMDHSWCDGINLHGAAHDVLVQNCDISFAGDDNLAVWSFQDAVYNIKFDRNSLGQVFSTNPYKAWGNCIAIYGGGAGIEVTNNKCYSTSDGIVKISENFGGSFSDKTHIVVSGNYVDNGRPECFFDGGRPDFLNVSGCSWATTGTIRSYQSGRCLEVPGSAPVNGNDLWVWECDMSEKQQWTWSPTDLAIRTALDPNMCIDTGDLQAAHGRALYLWECNGYPQQSFGYDLDKETIFIMQSSDATLCVDLAGANAFNGATVQVWDCNDMGNQRWEVDTLSSQPIASFF